MRKIESIPIEDLFTVATWLITDPASHPIWDQYLVFLLHLRGEKKGKPPVIALEGATHEWHCMALDTKNRLSIEDSLEKLGEAILSPPNMAYQFIAEDDAKAMKRVEEALNKAPSLDTDYRRWWNEEFSDGYGLVTSSLTGF